MSVLAGCFSCFGPTSSLEGDVLSLLEEYSLTRCVVRARTTGYRLGESPYGFVDEVGLVKIYIKKVPPAFQYNLSRCLEATRGEVNPA